MSNFRKNACKPSLKPIMTTMHAIKNNISYRSIFKNSVRNKRFGDPFLIIPPYFPPCTKGTGSPKQKRQGAPATQKRKGTERG